MRRREFLRVIGGAAAWPVCRSPYSTPAVALLAYQRIAPGWNGSKVFRVKSGGHSLGGGVARLHQLVVAGEDRLGDRIDQIVGQGAACHREIVEADGEAAKKRLHHNVLAIALANKLARIAWSVLCSRSSLRDEQASGCCVIVRE